MKPHTFVLLLSVMPLMQSPRAIADDRAIVVPVARPGDDPILQGYLDEALRVNPALAAHEAEVRASDADTDAARAQQWPEVSINARYTHADGGRTIEIPTGSLLNPVYETLNRTLEAQGQAPQFPSVSNQSISFLRDHEQETKLSLTAPLFAPQVWANVDAKRALADASRAGQEAYARTLVRELKRVYYAAIEAEAAIGILDASEKLLAENVRVSQALVDAGKATRDRVLRAQAEHLAALQQLDGARAQAAQARRLLNTLRVRPDDTPLLLPRPEALALPVHRAEEPHTRPELRQLDGNLAASAAGERAARGARLPTLALAADYGVQGEEYRFDDDADFDTISLVLRWQLWDTGSRRAQQRSAAAQSAALRARREDLARQLELSRRSADEDLGTALRAVTTGKARLAAADEGFRIAERKRDAAALSQIEFLDAERALREARLQLVIARCDALDRAAALELANASYPLPDNLMAP